MEDDERQTTRRDFARPSTRARSSVPARVADFVSRRLGRWGRSSAPLQPYGDRPRLRRHELSVVACDLRGFTLFSASVAPEHVVELLREYYGSVGEVVASFRGRIKDHAGDGTLALVGASRPSLDHADRAVAMALAIGALGDELARRWRRAGIELGLGVGVASGEVTVGAIEAGSRIESVAIGAAVNLASRLCARARAGQILVDERTAALVGGASRRSLESLDALQLKGFARPVPVFQALR